MRRGADPLSRCCYVTERLRRQRGLVVTVEFVVILHFKIAIDLFGQFTVWLYGAICIAVTQLAIDSNFLLLQSKNCIYKL